MDGEYERLCLLDVRSWLGGGVGLDGWIKCLKKSNKAEGIST